VVAAALPLLLLLLPLLLLPPLPPLLPLLPLLLFLTAASPTLTRAPHSSPQSETSTNAAWLAGQVTSHG
jgi:hypothetical protein